MDGQNIYRELSKKLLMENSGILPEIWKQVCDEEEAAMLNAMPATAETLAEKFNRPVEEIREKLARLFGRGVVFEQLKDGTVHYRMPRHVVQFHDATLLWRDAPKKMVELWVRFMDTEYPALLELVTTAKLPPFMRVIPVDYSLEPKNQVLAYEDAREMITGARSIAVVDCACRISQRRCDAPVNICLQLNRGADYALKRGTGRKLEPDEALALLKEAEEAGLVHLTENRAGQGNVLCNCCTCCCEMMRFAKSAKTGGVLSPSRFRASVDAALCTSCGACVEICPMDAVRLELEGGAEVGDGCIGCGLCATVCGPNAITMTAVRQEDFIPG